MSHLLTKTIIVGLVFTFITSRLSPTLALTPLPSPTPPRPTSSYELFWPIVAGKIPGDSLYSLKTFKENIQLLLALSPSKKSQTHLTLSKKRLVETEAILVEKKDYQLATQTLNASVNHLQKATEFFQQLDPQKTSELRQTIIREGENEVFFTNLLAQKLPSDQKQAFSQAAADMEQLLAKLKSS